MSCEKDEGDATGPSVTGRAEEPSSEWDSPSHRFSPFVALCGVGFLGRLSYEMARTPLTPLYAAQLGAPTALIGLIVAAVTITGIVAKLPSGALSDLFGFRRLMVAGALVKASGPFLYLAVLSWPQLLAVRLYHGFATALYAPPASALVAKVYPTHGETGWVCTAPRRTPGWCSGRWSAAPS